MHQQMRLHQRIQMPPPRPANPRDGGNRARAGSALSIREVATSPKSPSTSSFGPTPGESSRKLGESIKKLDQIVQNVHTKAASLILPSRMIVKPAVTATGTWKQNKWFQTITGDFEDFKEELRIWKTCGSHDNKPPPLIIETYLDVTRLKSSESLVLVDELNGKRWDVMEALNTSPDSSSASGGSDTSARMAQVVLERWQIELESGPMTDGEDFGPILPTIYKKAIVFNRSIYASSHLLPCWKLFKQSRSKAVHPALVPRCRILAGNPGGRVDSLRQPLTGSGNTKAVVDYALGELEVPVGRIHASVTFRNECACNFRVDDSESLLSSRFMGVDEYFFRLSVSQKAEASSRVASVDPGSLPTHRRRPGGVSNMQQTYGSLSTFHGNDPLGTSPISALRAIPAPGSDTSSSPDFPPTAVEAEPTHSLPTSGYAGIKKPMFRHLDVVNRRPSISFQPFKSGPLSGSPGPRVQESEPPSPQSSNRTVAPSTLTQARSRTSLTAGMPASLRSAHNVADHPLASSPKTTTPSRYSSSFGHRRARPSIGGASRTGDDEQGSSGRQSLSSSVAQPGSGFLFEAAGTGSGSLQGSDDNIEEFLKTLESNKTLKSLENMNRGESVINKAVAQLSKFHMMKESNNALSESMTTSMQMHRSSSSSSRQLSTMPGMVAPASMSTSSSPVKPLSPHTPHTPAIPSRLSENSIIEYGQNQNRRGGRQGAAAQMNAPGPSMEVASRQDGSTAIDIPISPRLGTYARRSSLVAQQTRSLAVDEDDADPAFLAHRSLSLGADDREPPTMSMLLQQQTQDLSPVGEDDAPHPLQSAAEIRAGSSAGMTRQDSQDKLPMSLLAPAISTSPYGRRRYTGMEVHSGRGQTPSSLTSRAGHTSAGGRTRSGYADAADDEPLVFDMSEMDAQSRRSLEENRGVAHARPGAGNERVQFERRRW